MRPLRPAHLWLALTFAFLLGCTACCGFDPFGPRVAFELDQTTFRSGDPIRVEIMYLFPTESRSYEAAIAPTYSAEPVTSSYIDGDTREVTLTAPSPGQWSVVIREDGKMIAHRWITVQ